MSLYVPLSQRLTPLFPALPIVPAALQPEATQARSNSRRHTMQTADKNRMDMCRPRRALTLGHTLESESETQGLGNGTTLNDVIPAHDCGVTCEEKGCAVCAFIKRVCTCVYVHAPVGVRVASETQWKVAALSQRPIPGEHWVCLPCLMLHTVNSHWVNYCGRLFSHHGHLL